ncbi:PAAR domain-containing protein [Brevibacillus brevis]|uniref:PAAR domain-containing protein n=1 Tax=Brevibacillus brevis TaxID=1393 RepID=UPI0007D8A3E5|nr:PAAR domain-containing protein [Brevibacillus brevis]
MPAVAFNGSKTTNVQTNDIEYRVWNPCQRTVEQCSGSGEDRECYEVCVGGWDYFSGGSSTIHGTVVATSPNVFVNGKPISRVNDSVTETETPQVPGEPVSNHTGGTGKVTIGNAKNVFSGGQLVATVGSTVKTHSTPTTTIADGSSNVFIGG